MRRDEIYYRILFAFGIVYVLWGLYITIDTWDLQVTRWEQFLLYSDPMMYCGIPMLILFFLLCREATN